jgi:hypothetical protein
MRPQGFGQVGGGLEDLGWDDMGFEPPKPTAVPRDSQHDAFGEEIGEEHPHIHPTGLTPVQSPVHTQQAEIADRLGNDEDGEEDEEFDETAELYDPNAVDEEDEDEEAEEEAGEEAEEEAGEGAEEEAEAEYESGPTGVPETYAAVDEVVEPAAGASADEPFELEERFEDFDPFEQGADETASIGAFVPPPPPPPPPAAYGQAFSVSTRQPAARAAPGSKSKAAFTLRLDPDRHLKLRLACAVNGRSAQQIVTDAVDQMLGGMPGLDAMAEKAKRKG